MRTMRSWSPTKKVVAVIVALIVVPFLWALLVSLPTPKPVRVWKGHNGGVWVSFSPDGHLLASAGTDDVLKLWRVRDGALLHTLKHCCHHLVAFSPDACLLAVEETIGTIKLWRVRDGKRLWTLEHDDSVTCLVFSPVGRLLASGSVDATVKLWRISDGKPLRTLKHNNEVWGIAFSPDGQLLASYARGYEVRLWRVSDGKLLRKWRGRWADFSPDGRLLAVVDEPFVKFWRVMDGKLVRVLKVEHSSDFRAVFSPDWRLFVLVGDDGTVKVWRVTDGKLVQTLRCDVGLPRVAFSPDSRFLLLLYDDGFIELWRVTDWQRLWRWEAPRATLYQRLLRFEPLLNRWGLSLPKWLQPPYDINSIAFSPDGRLLAVGMSDGAIYLWRVPQ